jgi:hypothetical protein
MVGVINIYVNFSESPVFAAIAEVKNVPNLSWLQISFHGIPITSKYTPLMDLGVAHGAELHIDIKDPDDSPVTEEPAPTYVFMPFVYS